MNQRTEPSAKYTHKQRNCQRNNVFKMIYSVVYVNIIESKDQRFGYMHRRNTVSVCLCYYMSESNICVIYNANENYFPFNFINNWGNQRTQFEFCRFQLFKYSFIAKKIQIRFLIQNFSDEDFLHRNRMQTTQRKYNLFNKEQKFTLTLKIAFRP